MKILSVIGTRPEAIKMAPVIRELSSRPEVFTSKVCVTAQHRQMTDQVLDLWDIKPDHDLDVMRPEQSLTDVTTAVLSRLVPVLELETPDWVLVQGDTTTAMAASLSAFYHGVPVGHIEAGLRTHDNEQPFPEEVNRRITAVIAKLHFAPTMWAADNLSREGVDARRIVVTGNTVIDALHQARALPCDLGRTPLAQIPRDGRKIILATSHRRENFGAGLRHICEALTELVDRHGDVRVVMPVHPNPHVSGPVYAMLGNLDQVTLLAPLDYQPLVHLLGQCHFLITDSGGLQEEATGIGKPVLILRETTERPEGVEAGTARLVGSDYAKITSWAERLLTEPKSYAAMSRATSPYGDGHAGVKIVDVLAESQVIELTDAGALSAPALDGGSTGELETLRLASVN